MFSKEHYLSWSQKAESQSIHDVVLYALMTENPLIIEQRNLYYDDPIWLDYYEGMLTNDSERVKNACKNFAEYFWNDCKVNELPTYAPESYPCFEPDYNAALTIALEKKQMKIVFEEKVYERFYIGALSGK